ncbi:hypothetical protein EDD11_009581 [Mortierella claussenii]|nr:hypothetical protein EDD11_009581 [Mortierella claussenii]
MDSAQQQQGSHAGNGETLQHQQQRHHQQSPVKGILKKSAHATDEHQQVDENAPRLKWDEENLIITEAQKDSTMKIDEPKTPFVHYNHELDKVIDPEEVFSLDGPKKKRAALAHTPPVPSYFPGLDDEDNDEYNDNDRDRDPEEWQDSDDDEEQHTLDHASVDHDKFARMRAEHYKMKEAITQGHNLVDTDEEEDEDERGVSKESRSRTGSSSSSSTTNSRQTQSKNDEQEDEDLPDMEL